MKKQHVQKDEVMRLFTFYDKCLLEATDSTDFFWQSFDYSRIDTEYEKVFDEIYYVKGLYLFLLFDRGILVGYRYDYADRRRLAYHLSIGGEYKPVD